jgi:hypothetical protein
MPLDKVVNKICSPLSTSDFSTNKRRIKSESLTPDHFKDYQPFGHGAISRTFSVLPLKNETPLP